MLQARQDKVTATNLAQAYENQVIPEARGRSEQIIQPAEAFKRARIERAQGEADQFLSVLKEYSNRSVRLSSTLQDTDNSDDDGNPATGIGIEDVTIIDSPDAEGDGPDLVVSNLLTLGATNCVFTAGRWSPPRTHSSASSRCRWTGSTATRRSARNSSPPTSATRTTAFLSSPHPAP